MKLRSAGAVLTVVATASLAAGAGGASVAGRAPDSVVRLTAQVTTDRGWQRVSFAGVSLRVPGSWPVINLARHPRACPQLNVHAVYLGKPGPDPACAADLQGRTTAVTLQRVAAAGPDLRQATRATVLGGRPGRTNPDAAVTHSIVDILPSADVEVSLSYGSSAKLARSIESTIKVSRRARPGALTRRDVLRPAAIRPAAAQGLVQGRGFDTCAAPSTATMKRWRASSFQAVGIYIGGVNRACSQANLSSAWISTIQSQGWHYFPFYVGLQAPCVAAEGDATINPATAGAQGKSAADDAVTQATDLGIPAGTPIIFDMEAYRGGCGSTVTTFLSAWDTELAARGYVAGVYESFSNISDLAGAASRITEPAVIHYADWDGDATTNSSYMPASLWTGHSRIHQYQGGHNENHGGATLNIDDDQLNVVLGGSGGGTATGQRRPAFRIATAINSNGSAEWFARATSGALRHNYQHPVGSSTWSATRAVGNSPADLVANPAVASDANGALTLVAQTSAGKIIHAWQHDGSPNDWEWSGAVGSGTAPSPSAAGPAAIRAPDGDVAVFVTTASGAVSTTSQDSPNDNTAWTAWTAIGGNCASPPVPLVTIHKTLEVFCRTTSGTLAVAADGQGGWQGWQTVTGGPGGVTGTPAVTTAAGGQTEVVVRATGAKLGYAWQPAAGGAWSWGTSPGGATRIKNSPSAVPWPGAGGGIAVFGQRSNGQLGYVVQQGAGAAGWGPWTPLSTHMYGSPTAWLNASGSPEVAVLDKQLKVSVSTWSGSSWSPWTSLGGGY
jgi:hypothetical protein